MVARSGAVWAASMCVLVAGCEGGSYGSPQDGPPSGCCLDPGAAVDRPLDSRPSVLAATPPPAITGGTLMITHDGKLAVAADPDRDQLSIVSIAERTVIHTVFFEKGEEPGRLVEDSSGHVHVVLRRSGALATVDLASGKSTRRAVCSAPRGLAYQADGDQVHVACSGGELVSFLASGGDPVRTLHLDMDLRDVIVKNDGLFVSRFKSAELLRLDTSGNVVKRSAPGGLVRMSQKFMPTTLGTGSQAFISSELQDVPEKLDAAVAWRTLAAPDGTITMLHQYALAEPIVIDDPETPTAPGPSGGDPSGGGGSAYGAPMGLCGGIVQPGVSTIEEDGTVVRGAPMQTVLAVDASISPDSAWVAIATAGTGDSPLDSSPGMGRVVILQTGTFGAAPGDTPVGCAPLPQQLGVAGQVTAVAFNPQVDAQAIATNTWLVVQTREPSALNIVRDPFSGVESTIQLSSRSVYDTGHEIFHRDAGSGIACASCHAEGEEDGRVWQFDPIGSRRTQAIDVGLEGTAPFHWDGDMNSFNTLIEEVFMHRMGGNDQTAERRNALSHYVFSLQPRTPLVDSESASAVRGKELFMSAGVGCATCHQGTKFTSNVSVEVGTTERGHALQVPSLIGVGYRAPFLHDGRAATLKDRFNPEKGGGDAHGHTSQLSSTQVDDLVAFLESL